MANEPKPNPADEDPYDGMANQVDEVFAGIESQRALEANNALITEIAQINNAQEVALTKKGRLSTTATLFNPAAINLFAKLQSYPETPQIMVDENGESSRLRRTYVYVPDVFDESDLIHPKLVFVDTVAKDNQRPYAEVDMTSVHGGRYYRFDNGKLYIRKKDGNFRRAGPFGVKLFANKLENNFRPHAQFKGVDQFDLAS